MKLIGFLIIASQVETTQLFAEEFTHKLALGSEKKIEISLLKKFHVNSECIKNQQDCLNLLKVPTTSTSVNKIIKQDKQVRGNPASDFCNFKEGKSEILRDQKNNEYDYCLLSDKYLVDSWDFYTQNKK